ncbi:MULTISPECIES: hypothetical protein [unclassified Pseudonocardia]|nr:MULTISPECIES: hypothetical protein [unclassified Pseudonocardia]
MSTAAVSATVQPRVTSPLTVATCRAPPSSPKTLSLSRDTFDRFVTDCS